jgi:hypothetical protein
LDTFRELVFKTKGPTHTMVSSKKSVHIAPEVVDSAEAFMEMFVTEPRLRQVRLCPPPLSVERVPSALSAPDLFASRRAGRKCAGEETQRRRRTPRWTSRRLVRANLCDGWRKMRLTQPSVRHPNNNNNNNDKALSWTGCAGTWRRRARTSSRSPT